MSYQRPTAVNASGMSAHTTSSAISRSARQVSGAPTGAATTVRIRAGKLSTTDGPFAETKEQLGGYYLIDAKDLNDAIQVAARIPGARVGSIEVRPIAETPHT